MCLTLNSDSEIKIAEKDIICYKILREDSEVYAISPYFDFEYIVGATYKINKKLKIRFGDNYEGDDSKFVEEGFHSFERLQSAMDFLYSRRKFFSRCRVYECVIPKGATVIYGRFCEFSAIVSDVIKVVKKV